MAFTNLRSLSAAVKFSQVSKSRAQGGREGGREERKSHPVVVLPQGVRTECQVPRCCSGSFV